jgi:hypothetical protein
MGIETIGEALSLGWRVMARGREDGPSSKSSRECTYRRELDMETLVHAGPGISVVIARKSIAIPAMWQ